MMIVDIQYEMDQFDENQIGWTEDKERCQLCNTDNVDNEYCENCIYFLNQFDI